LLIYCNNCGVIVGGLEMSDVLLRTDGKRGRWKVSGNKSVYCLWIN